MSPKRSVEIDLTEHLPTKIWVTRRGTSRYLFVQPWGHATAEVRKLTDAERISLIETLGGELPADKVSEAHEASGDVWTGQVWPGVRWEIELKKTKDLGEQYAIKVGDDFKRARDWLLSYGRDCAWMHNDDEQTLLFGTLTDALTFERTLAEELKD